MTRGLHNLSYNVKLPGITKRHTNTNVVYFWQQNVCYHVNAVLGEMWPVFKTVLSSAN